MADEDMINSPLWRKKIYQQCETVMLSLHQYGYYNNNIPSLKKYVYDLVCIRMNDGEMSWADLRNMMIESKHCKSALWLIKAQLSEALAAFSVGGIVNALLIDYRDKILYKEIDQILDNELRCLVNVLIANKSKQQKVSHLY